MEMNLIDVFGAYVAWEFAPKSWVIQFMSGSQNIYLLEGNEKALLLDTGYGTGTLRVFVERLTDKPILVANTHFHPDHASGNGEWASVLLSPNWHLDELSVTREGAGPFDISQLPYPDYEKVFIKGGDVLELGGRSVEVIDALPAHSNSSLFFLDWKNRLLFCGDEMESAQVLLYENSRNPEMAERYDVRERLLNFAANTQLLKDLSEHYDYLLPNHNGAPIAKSYLDDYLLLVDAIFAGTAVIDEKLNHKYIEMDPRAQGLCRIRHGKASIFLMREEVNKVYGKES
ncbi:MBL fold metallo-hydrolase [Streptococcus merionis]|uniref:Hydroxyacylglutathione hydrolase n=1 Tax=Streptococcus merionis TaxID=400065 RepID=A0A239T036_9STRE|nr:MBL fold metallo-hydrolase [Streptococcus merionis]SNU91080.1 hydroxyacylglutathione hydrolase [Streptococcus merionis]